MGTVSTDIPENADTAARIQIDPVSASTDILYAQTNRSKFSSQITEMATTSVRKIFMDAARESQHRVATASATSGGSCSAWSSSSSSSGMVNPPITMMARMVKEDGAKNNSGQSGWGNSWGSQKS